MAKKITPKVRRPARKQLGIRLPMEVCDSLAEWAKADGISVNLLCTQLLQTMVVAYDGGFDGLEKIGQSLFGPEIEKNIDAIIDRAIEKALSRSQVRQAVNRILAEKAPKRKR